MPAGSQARRESRRSITHIQYSSAEGLRSSRSPQTRPSNFRFAPTYGAIRRSFHLAYAESARSGADASGCGIDQEIAEPGVSPWHRELGELNPLFTGMEELFERLRSQGPAAFEFGGVPFHPGALRAYREAGLVSV